MKVEKRKFSARRRLNEARARRAERFHEGWREDARKWDNNYYSYLNSFYHFDDDPDDGYLKHYDTVCVYGCTKNVPLVVFEGNKKYLASYEYETAGELNAKSKEMFRITDSFDILSFDLYEFPKDGIVPDTWDEKKAVKVASIFEDSTDDIDRLDGITVADGTPVVKALKALTIEGVKKAYDDETAEEYLNRYDEVELNVKLYYKGELNEKSDKDMTEAIKKLRKRVKESSRRRMKEAAEDYWFKIYTYEVENDEPVIVRSNDGVKYECNYELECTADYSCDNYGITGELRDYKISVISFEGVDDLNNSMTFFEKDLREQRAQEVLKDFTVIDADKEVPLLQYISDVAGDSVDEFAWEAEDNLDPDDYYDPSVDYDPPRDSDW